MIRITQNQNVRGRVWLVREQSLCLQYCFPKFRNVPSALTQPFLYTLEIKIKGPVIFAYPLKKGLDLELIRMRRLNDWSRVIPVGNRNWSDCYAAAEGCGELHQGRLWTPRPLPLRVKLFHVQVKSPLIISVETLSFW